MLLGSAATAQAMDINRLHVPMTGDGLLSVDSPDPLWPMQLSATAYLGYAYDPAVWVYSNNTYSSVVSHQLLLDTIVGLGVIPLLDVAVSLPLILGQSATDDLGAVSGSALGDMRLLVRGNVLPARIFDGALSIVADVAVPTGAATQLAGSNGLTWAPRSVAA